MPRCVADHVQLDLDVLRLESFFVAFQRAVTDDAVTFEIGQQRQDGARTFLGLGQLGDVLDHRVRAFAHEARGEGAVAGEFPKFAGPGGQLVCGEQTKVCNSHVWYSCQK